MRFIKILSTPKRAALVIARILIDASGQTGVYYDENGGPMLSSALVRDLRFQARVVAETRALLSTIPAFFSLSLESGFEAAFCDALESLLFER